MFICLSEEWNQLTNACLRIYQLNHRRNSVKISALNDNIIEALYLELCGKVWMAFYYHYSRSGEPPRATQRGREPYFLFTPKSSEDKSPIRSIRLSDSFSDKISCFLTCHCREKTKKKNGDLGKSFDPNSESVVAVAAIERVNELLHVTIGLRSVRILAGRFRNWANGAMPCGCCCQRRKNFPGEWPVTSTIIRLVPKDWMMWSRPCFP